MFESMGAGGFDQVFAQDPMGNAPPLRVRKTLSQKLVFWLTNALVVPFIALIYIVVSGEGLNQQMSVLAMKLSKLPVPLASVMADYDGWNRLTLSTVVALVLFVVVSWAWYRVWVELMGFGSLWENRRKNPVAFYLLATVVGIVLLADLGVFYAGLEAKASGGWSETPAYVTPVATALFMAGTALLGWFHADHRYSGTV